MKVLVDIGHPAHVHLFKHFARDMEKRGHETLFTCRKKEFEAELLSHYGLRHVILGKKYASRAGKIWGLIEFSLKEWWTARKFKPDIFLSHGSMYAAYASYLIGKPHISMEDTFNAEQVRLYAPFTRAILTATYEHPFISRNTLKYPGYHELAYLHPNRFKPDESILETLGLRPGEKYVIMRFVAWKASHDAGHPGISYENKLKAVEAFSQYARVFISSESDLPPALEAFRIKIEPARMHDALAFAVMVFGESFTMLSEAAVLGVPAILVHNNTCYYLKELQDSYGLAFNFTESGQDQQKAIEKGVEVLTNNGTGMDWQARRKKMLEDKIDVTAFLVWFVENFPESMGIMKKEPSYSLRFHESFTKT